ncbi:hypothetical protein HNQ80_002083 [Anaerosolibacter carboniphilus]|uniref:Putative component of 'biosynthetic module' domain-containing protein n=1 Tax=Anaerosolibacter carboniphilus TaxID=1417629 RepID=A0A841KYK8_9FIRM|nr:hypothetical protein [Anaerosolibacter carboniphilus]
MPILETSAKKAEKEIRKILSAEKNVLRPWQLVNYEPIPLTLQTTIEEIEILFNTQAFLRPGFKVEDGKVYIPSLFVKLSGNSFDFLDILTCKTDGSKAKIVYNSTMDFENKKTLRYEDKKVDRILNEEGLIDKEKLYKSSQFKYYYLRKEYQDIIIDKINYILKNRNALFTPIVDVEDTKKIVYTLLNIDKDIMMLLHDFDYQYDIPSIIFYEEEDALFSDRIAYTLALLYLLGMDIIVISAIGYANLENVIQSDLFITFYSNTVKEKLKSYQNESSKNKEENSKRNITADQKRMIHGFTIDEIKFFVGEEAKSYMWPWKRSRNPSAYAEWNLASLIFGLSWLGYRKMYSTLLKFIVFLIIFDLI